MGNTTAVTSTLQQNTSPLLNRDVNASLRQALPRWMSGVLRHGRRDKSSPPPPMMRQHMLHVPNADTEAPARDTAQPSCRCLGLRADRDTLGKNLRRLPLDNHRYRMLGTPSRNLLLHFQSLSLLARFSRRKKSAGPHRFDINNIQSKTSAVRPRKT